MIAMLGKGILAGLAGLGQLTAFGVQGVLGLLRPPFRPGLWGQHILEVGYFSLPVVVVTAAFSGLVLTLQSYAGLASLASSTLAEASTPRVVLGALVQEFGPILAGLMIAGRMGAAMAAELGTMRVSAQIDALHTLSVAPLPYLVSPRLLAATVTLPLLTLVASVVGVGAGFLLATQGLGLNAEIYLTTTWEAFRWRDVGIGLTKAGAFGFLIALIATYQGYHSEGGAAGVGRATRQAVVQASIAILAANYLITAWFFEA